MGERPDSALAVIEGIDTCVLRGAQERARYSLLCSMALDKNYVDTTSLAVIAPAVEWYSRHGSADERLKAYYYEGCVYANRDDLGSAMHSYMRASEYAESATDTLAMALLYIAKGSVFYKWYNMVELASNIEQAIKLYEGKHLDARTLDCYYRALTAYNNLCDSVAVAKYMHKIDSLAPLAQCNPKEPMLYKLFYSVEYQHDSVESVIHSLLQFPDLTEDDSLEIAWAYLSVLDMPDEAMKYLSADSEPSDFILRLKYWETYINIAQARKDKDNVIKGFEHYYPLLWDISKAKFDNELSYLAEVHALEMENVNREARHQKATWIYVSLILLLLLITGTIFIRHRAVRERQRLNEARMRQRIGELEDEAVNLQELLERKGELPGSVLAVLKERCDVLNTLLVSQIASADRYLREFDSWVAAITSDQEKFMEHTRLALEAAYPKFIHHLQRQGLKEDEINYACLYAIGLKGREVGKYLHRPSHYTISSDIRRKLGLETHDTNLGNYIHKLLKEV